ncbi:MAG: EAL domain-containing response regulator [Hydrogenovibrio sp.]
MNHDVQSVLIVEDSKTQRVLLETLCADLGIATVLSAKNGRQAIDKLMSVPQIDLVICDLELPKIDGIEMLYLIGKRRKNFALLVMSGREQSLISAVELMAKSEGFYTLGAHKKPVKESDLTAVLHRFNRDELSRITQRFNRDQLSHILQSKAYKQTQISPADIKAALLDNQFALHFQPKVSCKKQTLQGVEALIRWQHPLHGMVSPGEFIPMAVEYNLIDLITLWVIQKAISTLDDWHKKGLKTRISVNLSAKSFEGPGFAQQVLNLLSERKIDPKRLVFEVTETELIRDIGMALRLLTKLRLCGFGLSIDDYGTGQSSIKQLTQIPFTELKVDRSLIDGIHAQDHLKVIFESTLRMSHKLNIEVVAEGIEKVADWQYLANSGCDLAQGFLICPPVSEEVLRKWVKNGHKFLTHPQS